MPLLPTTERSKARAVVAMRVATDRAAAPHSIILRCTDGLLIISLLPFSVFYFRSCEQRNEKRNADQCTAQARRFRRVCKGARPCARRAHHEPRGTRSHRWCARCCRPADGGPGDPESHLCPPTKSA